MKVNTVRRVLENNDAIAEGNRKIFKEAGVLALNFISSPGSGKTTLLQKTMEKILPKQKTVVIVGDLQTTRDAERLAPQALDVVQINTGLSCHLYANQISASLSELSLSAADFVFIENVGNLVCPGEFDLGENLKVVLLSMPEGDDKVAKYPTVFRVADIVLLTKMDLKDVLDFDFEKVTADIRKLNENVPIYRISSKTGRGMDEWIAWLQVQLKKSIGVGSKFVTEE